MALPLRRRILIGAAAGTAAALALAGCTAGETPEADGPVTLVVGDMPPGTNEAGRALFEEKVEAFQDAYPDITLEPTETVYDPQTFAAQLAGGTLPTVLTVPFTDIQSLIAREQIKDLSSYYQSSEALQMLNPSVSANVQSTDGAYYGIPTSAFTLALMINRGVFEDAGIDPDTVSLETWEDVADVAEEISANTDAAGLAQLTSNNQGGWILTAMTAAFGDVIQEVDGETVTANVDNDATKAALEYLRDLRWERDAMGSNFLMQFEDAGQALASGQYGMLVGASQWYNAFTVNYSMPKEDFGLFPIPQTEDGLGSLGGGSVAIVRADATEAEAAAAVKWTEFYYLDRFVDLEFGAEEAATQSAAGGAVPRVGLALVDADTYSAYLEAIADSINVPLENLTAYTEASEADDFSVVTEPPVEAQQVYSILDSVIQAVLTDQNADIDALLAAAQTQVESILASAQG